MTKPSNNGMWPAPTINAAPSAALSPSRGTNDREQQLISSCESFSLYPSNLSRTLTLEHTLDLYHRTLSCQSRRLFNPSPQTKLLKFWETNEASDGFEEFQSRDFASLKNHCQERGRQDPTCRYVFIQSKNSRGRLELTQDDFAYLASYHQVMPSFLDLVFTCGSQEKPQDFHYTAFRHENYLVKEHQNSDQNFKMERLGRSGRQIQHCFSLHSVERSDSNPDWRWSIRQTVAYHSFDVETGKSFWIFIKGNDAMEKRIRRATLSTRDMDMKASSHRTLTGSFGASLTAHIQMIEWCGEQWRWYINEVETILREKAKNAVLADVDSLAGPSSVPASSRLGTLLIPKTPRTTMSNASPSSPVSPSKIWARLSGTSKTGRKPTVDGSYMLRPIHADNIVEEPEQIEEANDDEDDDDDANLEHMFSFEKLQDLHQTGEYMQEALMVLKQNHNIIHEIREHYTMLMQDEDLPTEIRDGSKLDISKFNQRALSIEKDLEVQQSRLETLNVLLEDRSNLFYTVQQYSSMQASKHFAMNAQASTDFTTNMTARMHIMTEKMHDIALKTNNQTVSMHVITVFTLVFLPGTFLAVSLLRLLLSTRTALITGQTFFSSGILRWYDSDDEMAGSKYSWETEHDRLVLFLEIVVPMMVLIIVAWLALYLRSKAKRSEEEEQQGLIDLEKGPEISH
ncbi:hypothetical protein F4818DRAFT_402641 [Hypoxylon cercidicola]|nr:hypothetical protein F4818DRAFT_402641 [Hypoxylon cercidicola]